MLVAECYDWCVDNRRDENTAELCTDGSDNDCDLMLDCDDPDCQALGAEFCPTECTPGECSSHGAVPCCMSGQAWPCCESEDADQCCGMDACDEWQGIRDALQWKFYRCVGGFWQFLGLIRGCAPGDVPAEWECTSVDWSGSW
ncbi:MAG: hypothetical protein HYY06_15400 [Deltaproteobacteria bacterium]|nr:hypothetical protein [Deltaproteobacteria bacterium]